ncbi:MAG: SpoIID/LytB domain-containing protein [Nitrospirales bacterium]
MNGLRLRVAFLILVLLVLPVPSVWADDPIRVLLFQDLSTVWLSAERGVILEFPDRGPRLVRAPIRVETAPGLGLRVNGSTVSADRLIVRGREEPLTVTYEPRLGSAGGHGDGPKLESSSLRLAFDGILEVKAGSAGLVGINVVDLEAYVKGVVPAEMNAGWHEEALKAQAVASRTYAVYQRAVNAGQDYDVISTVRDQVYKGRGAVTPRVESAVEATRGMVLTYEGAPILATFSSTAAGPTEDAANVWAKDLPYLKGVDCPFDQQSPHFEWQARFRLEDLEAGLLREGFAVGAIASMTPYAYSRAGRVTKVRILHSVGELVLRGEALRRAVGYQVIRSTQFHIEFFGRDVVLSGHGAGHAVGLCQWGAKELAEMGHSFQAILFYYFPGTELEPLRATRLVFSAQP